MAVLYVSEYPNGGQSGTFGQTAAVQEPETTTQTVAITAGSVQSNAFNTGTRFIRVHADLACSILVGANPTATTTHKRLAANQTEYFFVQGGHKIAVIAN